MLRQIALAGDRHPNQFQHEWTGWRLELLGTKPGTGTEGTGPEQHSDLYPKITSTGNGLYKMVKAFAAQEEIQMDGFCLHALRATAAANTLEHVADIAFVQRWLGNTNNSTIRLFDLRRSLPEDSPTFKVNY